MMSDETLVSVEEISKHCSIDDCWIVVDDCVWDITEFAPEHPGGGDIIWKFAGRDATATYSSAHAPSIIATTLPASKLKGRVDRRTLTDEWSRPPPAATPELQLQQRPALETIISADDFEQVARRTASKKTWAFYSSADTGCLTRDLNRRYFDRILWRPRLLRNVRGLSTRSTVLGHPVGAPFFVSPAAMARMIHPEGELAIARGCATYAVPQGISTNAAFPVEEIVRCVPPGKRPPFFFQLYVNKDRTKSETLLKHVRSLGIDVIMVTIDAPMPGKREADERVKSDEGLGAPMTGAKATNDKRGGGMGRLMGSYIADDLTWADFTWLKKHWDGKIVVKGVQSWQDAKRCADEGLDGVLLSNHGGRNLDTSPPAILTLLECQLNCPSIFEQLEIYIDGGIRRGADVLKCLCLGATAVGLGRPFLYAVNYGQGGVEHLIEILQTELSTAMALVGITDLDQCHAGYVNTADLDWLLPRGEGHPYASGRKLRSARLGAVARL